MATWAVLILPYTEQGNLYDLWDVKRSFYYQVPAARETIVTTYLCPSRSRDEAFVLSKPDGVHSYADQEYPSAPSDYGSILGSFFVSGGFKFCVFGDGAITCADHDQWPGYPLVMGKWKSRTSISKIVDGTSNTFLFGESSAARSRSAAAYNGDVNQGYILGDLFSITNSEDDWGAGSSHPQICQFVFVDGHVTPLPEMTYDNLSCVISGNFPRAP